MTLATAYSIQYNLNSNDNKQQFLSVWEVVKSIHKDSRVEEVKLMKQVAKEAIKLDSARREYNKLLSNIEAYALLPDRYINLSAISYENLVRVLKLVVRVTKYYDGDMTKIDTLSPVWESGMSSYRYNNALEEVCKKLNEALPAIVVTKVTVESALLYLDGLDLTVKRAMLERLLADFHMTEEEVA